MFQNLHWAIPFFIGFLSAVTIWIGLGVIRFWIDIRKTKKAILANDLIADDDELLCSAIKLITNSQNSLRMTKQLNPDWLSPLLKEIPILVESIAKLYYPENPDPIKAPKIGEFTRAVELAATDIANFLQNRRIGRLVDFSAGRAFRGYERGKKMADNPFLRICSPIYKRVRPVVQALRYNSPLTWVGLATSNAAARVLQPAIIGIIGKRATQLYSGALDRSDEAMSPAD
jgi:hypothetical protein